MDADLAALAEAHGVATWYEDWHRERRDVAVEMKVVRVDGDLAVCEAADGDVRTVEIALLDAVEEGDALLVHADVALVRV